MALDDVWKAALATKGNMFIGQAGDKFSQLKAALEQRGIHMKRFLGAGLTAVLFEDTCGHVRRLESKEFGYSGEALDNPIVFKAYESETIDIPGLNVQVRTMLKGENPGTIGEGDFLRTLAVLKRTDQLSHWKDAHFGNMLYIRGEDGEYLSYPDGHPIAFISDLNGIPATFDEGAAKELGKLPGPERTLAIQWNVTPEEAYARIPEASDADVAACRQQYALIERMKQKQPTRPFVESTITSPKGSLGR